MISFNKFILSNGLRLIVHTDHSTPLVAVNLLYQVGSKHEDPSRTGFAHLFEHLMFSGSENIADFDEVIQNCGGENNAFTNNDITNFYELVPAENIETALWLESDRMRKLNINDRSLEIQKKVVVEEFKETCLNAPYGDVWHHLSDMAYKKHPYRWPTIGLVPEHIENATLDEVTNFYNKFYTPDNAILVLAGNVEFEKAKELTQKWFGSIVKAKKERVKLPIEPAQKYFQQKTVESNIPIKSFYMAFHMENRMHADYYNCDLISDILASGRSSRFYQRLYKQQKLFNSIDAYISGYTDHGLFVIEGKLTPDTSMEKAKAAVWEELEVLKENLVEKTELQKLKNKIESSLVFSEVNILNKATSLAYFEHLGDAEMINQQGIKYKQVLPAMIQQCARKVFRKDNCSELTYLPLVSE